MPREIESGWEDGLRSLRRDEFNSLAALVEEVFRPGLVAEYPQFYTPENVHGMRVVVDQGKVVSHVGCLTRDVSILGCTARAACLGGVATHEAYRGKGYATSLFADTIRVCREDRVDFILVSGYRKMYHRFGCRYVGKDWNYVIKTEPAEVFDTGKIELHPARLEDLCELGKIYRYETVRWIRPLSDLEAFVKGFLLKNRVVKVHLIRGSGGIRGYVVLMEPEHQGDRIAHVLEAAGERGVLTSALGKLIKEYNLKQVNIHVLGHDSQFQYLLNHHGAERNPVNASGTVTLVNFVQFMERMRPHFVELVGENSAKGLVFQERGDKLVFSYSGDEVIAENQGEAVEVIFGTRERKEEQILERGGRAAEILREIFPIPALYYGVNYL